MEKVWKTISAASSSSNYYLFNDINLPIILFVSNFVLSISNGSLYIFCINLT